MNMKTKSIFCATLAIVAAACNNDYESVLGPASDNPVAATIHASITDAGTRASGTAWAADDRIGVTATGEQGTSYTNIPFRYDSTNFLPDDKGIFFLNDGEEVSFTAYYPYTGTDGVITADTDAASQADGVQPTIDFLYASGATASKASPSVNFTGDASFSHRMSQISLTFVEGEEITFKDKLEKYEISGLNLKGTFDPSTGIAATVPSASTLSISPGGTAIENGRFTSSVILFPQSAGEVVLKVYVDGVSYETELPIPESELKAGDNYTFSISVSKTDIRIETATIRPWVSVGSGYIDFII